MVYLILYKENMSYLSSDVELSVNKKWLYIIFTIRFICLFFILSLRKSQFVQ